MSSKQKPSIIESCRSDDLALCRDMVRRYGLTEDRMHQAAEAYQLGRSRSGLPIYWLVDECGKVRDGHIGDTDWSPASWVSTLLRSRFPPALARLIPPTDHCLFGQHLIAPLLHGRAGARTVAVVESPRSAVILSALYPESLWLASVYPANLTADRLAPLRGCPVRLFPGTDETMDTFMAWLETADQARRLYRMDIRVSTLLEDRATASQKARGIDLLGYYAETLRQST